MARPFYTPDEEEQMLAEIADVGGRQAQIRSELASSNGQELSDVIADMNVAFPSVQADVLLAASQAMVSGVMTEDEAFGFVQDFQNKAILNAQNMAQQNRGVGGGAGGGGAESPDERGWFSKYVKDPLYGGLKGASRTTIAGLSTVEQLLTNVETRLPQEVVRPGDMDKATWTLESPDGTKTTAYRPTASWWDPRAILATTDLYQLLSGKDTGSGFFIEGEARLAQAEAAKDYRGAIQVPNPNAPGGAGFDIVGMTPGRILGTAFARPGSEQYNNVSGLVDATLVMTAPTGVPAAKSAVKGATGAVSSATKGSLRQTFGLTNGVTPFVRPEKVSGWLASGDGQRLVRNVAGIKDISDARRLLPNANARVWNDLVQTTNETEALVTLERVLGAERGAMNVSEMDWSNWSNVKASVLRNPVSRYLSVERKLTRAPSRNLVLGFANDAEITETVKNAEDWLKIVYSSPAERNPVLNRLTNALLDNKGDIKDSITEFKTIFADAVEKFGVPRAFAEEVFERGIKEGDEMNAFNALDDSGLGDIYNAVATRYFFQDETGKLVPGTMSTRSKKRGWLDSEHARYKIQMPDPRAVQRLTKPYNWMFSRAGVNKAGKTITNPPLPNALTELGKPRLPVAAMDFVHNKVFKRAALGSGGYGWRIANEGLFAQSFAPGIRTGVFHPVELASALLFRRKRVGKYKGSVTGEQWSDVLGTFRNKAEADKVISETFKDAVEFVEGGLTKDLDPGVLEKATYAAGAWRPARREAEFYVRHVADNIHLISNDRITRLIAEGNTPQQIVDMAQAGDRRILSALKDFESRKAGEGFLDLGGQSQKGSFKIFDQNGNIIRSNAVGIIEDYFVQRFRRFTVGDSRLVDIVKNGGDFGKFLPTGATEEVNAFTRLQQGLFGPEAVADYSDEFIDVVKEILETTPDAFPMWVKGRVNRTTNVVTKAPESQKAVLRSWDNFTRRLFANILTRPDKTLNRSVVWRKFYHEGIDLLLPQLDQDEAAKIVDNIKKAMADNKVKFTDARAGRWIGSKETWDRIVGYADGTVPATGSRTFEEIDAVARGFAADNAASVLYNATEQSNLAVALSVLEPFANAFKDGVTRWPRLLLSQPNETKRLYNGFEGLAQADPDQDGQGYFYRDPTTGQWSYAYPTGLLGSETVASLLYGMAGATLGGAMLGLPGAIAGGGAGGYLGYSTSQAAAESDLDFPLVGQLRTANVAISAMPSGGPALTIPATALLSWGPTRRVIPKAEDIYAWMTPYGEQSAESLVVPSWAQKMADIISSDPNTPSLVADARLQAYDALWATGKYTSRTRDPDEQAQLNADLLDDAAQVAQHMVLQRALGQFILPMRPKIEVMVPTQFEGQITIDEITTMVNGNVSNAVLSRALGLLREEDPATAVRKYIEFFGEDAIGYMVGKTYTNIDGLQATRQFDQWERDNPDIVKNVPDVYPYFAGRLGTDIDFTKYQSQIASGQRERWQDPEARRESAEYFVGSRLYQSVLASMDNEPNPLQREYLKTYRENLVEIFPGYGTAPFDINELPRKISQLEEASRLEVTQNNEVGTALRSYFAMRDRVLEAADARGSGLSADENTDLRSVLLLHGIGLTQQYPSFQMVWDDVLFREIDS
jgi:hypothetical protein